MDLRVKQIVVNTDCKTKDNVTLSVSTAVQFKIDKRRLSQAVFQVTDPIGQIVTAVNNVVRSNVPDLDLDHAYSQKDELCEKIVNSVTKQMGAIGFVITNALIVDLRPDRTVLASMNQINASKRHREAAIEQGEAQKVLQVKAAEADAESKFLSGQGSARMRVEMAKGFKQSMEAMEAGGLSPKEAMNMMITTQYVDTLKDFATNPSKAAMMVPQVGIGAKDLESQVRDGFLVANKLAAVTDAPRTTPAASPPAAASPAPVVAQQRAADPRRRNQSSSPPPRGSNATARSNESDQNQGVMRLVNGVLDML